MMKRSIIALAAIFALGITSCNDASDQIKDDGGNSTAVESNDNSAQTNAGNEVNADMVSQSGTPVFTFEKESHDFGTIPEGEIVKHDFTFTNTGDAPLIISNARGSCGCTVPEWPREPIAPGESGTIHVEFNSNGRPGNATKQVTIDANTVPNTKVLNIHANVTPKAGAEAGAAQG